MPSTTVTNSPRGRAVLTRIGQEATVGTAPATWFPARFYSLTAGMDRPLVRDDKLGVAMTNVRDVGVRRQGLPGGQLRRSVPLNLNELPHWLAAGFGLATTGAAPNLVHTFSPAPVPFNTLTLLQQYDTGEWAWDLGVALASIRIQAQKAETTARADLTLIGLNDATGASAPAGTINAAYADEDFADWRWRVLWNGVAIGDALEFDMTIDLGVERIQGLSGDEWPTRHHFGDVVVSGSLRLYGTAASFRALGAAGTAGSLVIEATHPANPTNRYVRFTMGDAQFERPQREVGGPGQMSTPLSFQAGQDSGNAALVIAVGNGVTSY